ncbi:MAG: hypothetical protein RhofKO_41100 [Rhodothermales bacterium]
MENLPDHLLAVIRSEIPDDEEILWAGQPDEWEASKRGWPIFGFAIPWTLFSIFWMFAAAGFGMPNFGDGTGFFALFGIPFVLIGLFMLASPFFMARNAKHTVYVVTDQRALIFTGKDSVEVETYAPNELNSLDRTIRSNGTGSIRFKEPPKAKNNRNSVQLKLDKSGFYGIPDAQYVYDTLRQLQASGTTPASNVEHEGMVDDYHGVGTPSKRASRTRA